MAFISAVQCSPTVVQTPCSVRLLTVKYHSSSGIGTIYRSYYEANSPGLPVSVAHLRNRKPCLAINASSKDYLVNLMKQECFKGWSVYLASKEVVISKDALRSILEFEFEVYLTKDDSYLSYCPSVLQSGQPPSLHYDAGPSGSNARTGLPPTKEPCVQALNKVNDRVRPV